jgi:pyrroline-5-carboxylate reductase
MDQNIMTEIRSSQKSFFKTIQQKTKVGFIGSGHITHSLCRGFLDSKTLIASHIYVTNRTSNKAIKIAEDLGVSYFLTNEEILDHVDIIFLSVKPINFPELLDDLSQYIQPHHHIVSLAAGISLDSISKQLNYHGKISRVIPNTAVSILKGVVGIFSKQEALSLKLLDLFTPLGSVTVLEREEQLDSLLVATSSGLGFTLEIISYFTEWLESHGFSREKSRQLIESTFIGAGLMSSLSPQKSLDDLIAQVTSKKGVTASGLDSMRSLELDRIIRISLDKAQNRNEELARLLE